MSPVSRERIGYASRPVEAIPGQHIISTELAMSLHLHKTGHNPAAQSLPCYTPATILRLCTAQQQSPHPYSNTTQQELVQHVEQIVRQTLKTALQYRIVYTRHVQKKEDSKCNQQQQGSEGVEDGGFGKPFSSKRRRPAQKNY